MFQQINQEISKINAISTFTNETLKNTTEIHVKTEQQMREVKSYRL